MSSSLVQVHCPNCDSDMNLKDDGTCPNCGAVVDQKKAAAYGAASAGGSATGGGAGASPKPRQPAGGAGGASGAGSAWPGAGAGPGAQAPPPGGAQATAQGASAAANSTAGAGGPSPATPMRDYKEVLQQCKALREEGCKIYGVFGWDWTGKSCFVYSVGKTIDFSHRIKYFKTDGPSWKNLYEEMANIFSSSTKKGTKKGEFYPYRIMRKSKLYSSNIALIDIAGEDFGTFAAWTGYMDQFFINYVPKCDGFFIVVNPFRKFVEYEVDGNKISRECFRGVNEQLRLISDFLVLVSAIRSKARQVKDDEQKILEAVKSGDFRKTMAMYECNIPISLCFSNSDAWGRFASPDSGTGRKSAPRSLVGEGGSVFCADASRLPVEKTAAQFLNWVDEGHMQEILAKAPKLKIEWLSSLGADFEEKKRKWAGLPDKDRLENWLDWQPKPLGLASIFNFVMLKRPGFFTKATESYWRSVRTRVGR